LRKTLENAQRKPKIPFIVLAKKKSGEGSIQVALSMKKVSGLEI